eukprot:TRINITY_DN287_c0_g4_i1.p2 TRINITY_DN287_c0_g4~~TRINITY_DN287_c0_g4_i1.p2  ORF type:complete len:591 (-),score=35.91 TRINITY_DN287_c0_g4_i1:113-1885(-)
MYSLYVRRLFSYRLSYIWSIHMQNSFLLLVILSLILANLRAAANESSPHELRSAHVRTVESRTFDYDRSVADIEPEDRGFSGMLSEEEDSKFGDGAVPLRWFRNLTDFLFATIRNYPTSAFARGGEPHKRAYAVLTEAMYDAWCAYQLLTCDPASGIRTIALLFQTRENVEKSISFAAYSVASNIYGSHGPLAQKAVDDALIQLGYDVSEKNKRSLLSAAGVGNVVGHLVIKWREGDGSNQYGKVRQSNGANYSDYTYYFPKNDPMPAVGRSDCTKLRSIVHWQPATSMGRNGPVSQNYTFSHFARIRPFSFPFSEFLLAPPPSGPYTQSDSEWLDKIYDLVNVSSDLDDYKKIVASLWSFDVFQRENNFIADIVQTLKYSLSKTVKLLLMIGEVSLDSQTAELFSKRFYDHARPPTAIQCSLGNKNVYSRLGFYLGNGLIPASNWSTYLPNFIVVFTNSEYISGGVMFYGSVMKILELATGRTRYSGPTFSFAPGSHPYEGKIDDPTNPGYVAGLTDVPNTGVGTKGYVPATQINVTFSTWEDVTLSVLNGRLYMGIHFRPTLQVSRDYADIVAHLVFEKAKTMFAWRS